MIPFNTLIYLYFIRRNPQDKNTFFNEIFHFHRFISIEKLFLWEKLFIFHDFQVNDQEFDSIFTNLLFHELVSDSFHLTLNGEQYLDEWEQKDPVFFSFFRLFLDQYHDEAATEKSCFSPQSFFAVSCSFCINQTCLKSKSNLIDFLPLSLRKKKNPHKSFSA